MRVSLILALLVTVSLTAGAHKIKDPVSLFNRSEILKVTSIEYLPEATVLTFKTTKECTPVLKITHSTYIVDDNGVRHYVIGTDGIKLDSLYVMVKGQSRKFSIAFDPVDADNKLLDMTVPETISIYGLHDKNYKFTIPEVEKAIDNDEYRILSSGEEEYVEIEGTYHSREDVDGTVLYFEYDYFRPRIPARADQYAKVDKDGHFKLRFFMETPMRVVLRKGTLLYGEYLGFLYMRPGDKLQMDVYDRTEGKPLTTHNLSGRKTYDKYADQISYLRFINLQDYLHDYHSNLTHMGYDAHYEDLWDCYKKDSVFVNYLCWRNKFSPFESHLLITAFKEMYLCRFLTLDTVVRNLYLRMKDSEESAIAYHEDDEFDGSDTTRFRQYMDRMDYAYLNILDPNDLTYMTISSFDGDANMTFQLPIMSRCHELVAKDDPDRWMKVIELQCKELNKITGWTGVPFAVQMMIASDYFNLFNGKPADERQYQKVRELLTNPYCRKLLDNTHQELKDRASQ